VDALPKNTKNILYILRYCKLRQVK